MKNKAFALLTSLAMAIGAAAPSLADGPVHSATAAAGASTAAFIDSPEGVLLDGGYRVPKHCWHSLAVALGNEHGLGQNVVGFGLGVPVGVVWGIPYGAIHGLKHGLSHGWDKPFSTDSFMVSEEK